MTPVGGQFMFDRVLRLLFRGPTPYRRLRMIDGTLHGEVAWGRGRYETLEPASITFVREYMVSQAFIFVNGFLVVVSNRKKYGVSVFHEDFDQIVHYIEENTPFEIRSRFVHRFNRFCGLLRKPVSQLLSRRKKGDR